MRQIILTAIIALIGFTLIISTDLSLQKISDKKNFKILSNNFVRMFLSYFIGITVLLMLLKLFI